MSTWTDHRTWRLQPPDSGAPDCYLKISLPGVHPGLDDEAARTRWAAAASLPVAPVIGVDVGGTPSNGS